MTTERINDLVHPAIKGDHEAMQALMKLGEDYLKVADLDNAVQAFKEAAIAYRIDAFRQTANYAMETQTSHWRSEIIKFIFMAWLDENDHVVPHRRPEILSIPSEKLIELLRDGSFSTVLRFLEQTLASKGVEFYSPGGSSLRQILRLIKAFGGENDEWATPFLADANIRIALDQITDRIVGTPKRNIR